MLSPSTSNLDDSVVNRSTEDDEFFDYEMANFVLSPRQAKSKEPRALDAQAKYRKAMVVLADIAHDMSEHGMPQFQGYIANLYAMKKLIHEGKELLVQEKSTHHINVINVDENQVEPQETSSKPFSFRRGVKSRGRGKGPSSQRSFRGKPKSVRGRRSRSAMGTPVTTNLISPSSAPNTSIIDDRLLKSTF